MRDGVFALTEGSATRPADLVIRQGGTANQLTRVNEDVLGPLSLARAERLLAIPQALTERESRDGCYIRQVTTIASVTRSFSNCMAGRTLPTGLISQLS